MTGRLHPARWPWWLLVVVVHLAARAVSAVVLVAVARTQAANPWTGAAPSYLEYAGLMWDGSWYRQIAEDGYPAELPRDAEGRVQQNAWAFFPLLPLLARAVTTVTGLAWHQVAPLLALALGTLAMVVVHRLVEDALERSDVARVAPPRAVALGTVVLLTTAASTPVLQAAYTESLALLLVATALLLLVRRRYLWAVPVVLAVGFTRAVALPLAVAVLLHGAVRWWAARRGRESFPPGERGRVLVLLGAAVVAGFAWPAVVGLRAGELDAYAQTQEAWRGTGEVVPFRPWFDVARWLLGDVLGPVVLVLLVALLAAVLLTPAARRLGPELLGWTAGYVGYLLAVLEPGTSLVRFALLAFPYWVLLAAWLVRLRRRAPVAGLTLLGSFVALGLAGQVAWVALLWRLVPPSGWPP